jgi:hypothetical protein
MMRPRLYAAIATVLLGLPAADAMAQSARHRGADGQHHEQAVGTTSRHARQPCQGHRGRGQLHPKRGRRRPEQGVDLRRPTVPVTVRFSDSTGLPALPDGSPPANPHGMSIKFHANGTEVDVVTNSLPFFPVATGEDFLALLQALSVSGPDAPKPTKADEFIAAHPTVKQGFRRDQHAGELSRVRPITASTPSFSSTPPATGSRSGSGSCRLAGRSICRRRTQQSSRRISWSMNCRGGWRRGRWCSI